MAADPGTMAVYASMADTYADTVARAEPDADLLAFMEALPRGARVLDWGCGVGNAAVLMAAAGIEVDATDASPEMAAIAAQMGIAVRVEPFEALDATDLYHGIWANFSLIHVARDAFDPLIGHAVRALVPGGLLHLGMAPRASGAPAEVRDDLGSLFSFWTVEELGAICHTHGLRQVALREGRTSGLGRSYDYLIARYTKDAS